MTKQIFDQSLSNHSLHYKQMQSKSFIEVIEVSEASVQRDHREKNGQIGCRHLDTAITANHQVMPSTTF